MSITWKRVDLFFQTRRIITRLIQSLNLISLLLEEKIAFILKNMRTLQGRIKWIIKEATQMIMIISEKENTGITMRKEIIQEILLL